MNLFDNVASALSDKFNKPSANRTIDVRTVEELLKDNLQLHLTIADILDARTDKEMNTWFKDILKVNLKDSTSPLKDVYDKLFAKFKVGAVAAERKRPLSALANANRAYATAIKEIIDKIDTLFGADKVDISSCRTSNLAVLGVLHDSDVLANFTMYLYTYLSRVAIDDSNGVPKYRQVYVLEHLDEVVDKVNKVYEKKGIVKLVDEIEFSRNNGTDAALSVVAPFDFNKQTVTRGFGQSMWDAIGNVLHCLNIFVHISNAIDDYRLKKNRRNRETKEWLEQHVALLKLELANKDQNDPEYNKLMNIIKAYDEQIAEYDQLINEFEKDE